LFRSPAPPTLPPRAAATGRSRTEDRPVAVAVAVGAAGRLSTNCLAPFRSEPAPSEGHPVCHSGPSQSSRSSRASVLVSRQGRTVRFQHLEPGEGGSLGAIMPNGTPPPAFTLHTSFSPLLSLYDSFLLDQFGVIHDGSRSLRGAADCIRTMLDREKKLAVLSNTSSPSHVAQGRLQKYGLRADMFAGGLVSSGEECARFARENYCRSGGVEAKALWFTWKEGASQDPPSFLAHCEGGAEGEGDGSIGVARSVEEADFVLCHGSEVWRRSRRGDGGDDVIDLNFLNDEEYDVLDPLLEGCARRNLPMVCANPDLVVGLAGGVVGNMPGKIARRYEGKGGTVHHFGKPDPRPFRACLANLGVTESTGRAAHVGDSLEHDVAGACAAGIDSVFVLGGIHAHELGLKPTGADDAGVVVMEDGDAVEGEGYVTRSELTARLDAFFRERPELPRPTHVVPSLALGSS
ncbi:hypothetical protein ACHAWF_003287, partial [Thalassiosira exigua]